jgi:hypothetical protein
MLAPLRKGLRGEVFWGWDRSRDEGQPRAIIQPTHSRRQKVPDRRSVSRSVSASEVNTGLPLAYK